MSRRNIKENQWQGFDGKILTILCHSLPKGMMKFIYNIAITLLYGHIKLNLMIKCNEGFKNNQNEILFKKFVCKNCKSLENTKSFDQSFDNFDNSMHKNYPFIIRKKRTNIFSYYQFLNLISYSKKLRALKEQYMQDNFKILFLNCI